MLLLPLCVTAPPNETIHDAFVRRHLFLQAMTGRAGPSRRHRARRVVVQGVHTAVSTVVWRHGYCGVTRDGPSHCQTVTSGAYRLDSPLSWRQATADCQARCAACARCRYISLSVRSRECSWFASCDMDRLHRAVPGFRSLDTSVRRPAAAEADAPTVLCVGTVQPARPQRWALAPVLYAPVDVCGPPLKAERSPLAGGPVG